MVEKIPLKYIVLSAFSLVLIDQIVKIFVRLTDPDLSIGFLRIIFVKNTGMAFSLFRGYNLMFLLIGLVLVFVGIYYKDIFIGEFGKTAFVLILSGAASNLIDRLYLGYVVDMISIGTFPIFNLADSMVTIGCALILIKYFKEHQEMIKNNKKGKSI